MEVDGEFEGSRAIENGPLSITEVGHLLSTKSVEEGRVIGLLVAPETGQAKVQGTGPAPRPQRQLYGSENVRRCGYLVNEIKIYVACATYHCRLSC